MTISYSKLFKYGLIVLGSVLIISLVLNWGIKKKIVSTLDNSMPASIKLAYKTIDINALSRSLALKNIDLQLIDSTDQSELGKFSIDQLHLKGFGVLDYIFNQKISLNNIVLSSPKGYIIIKKDTSQVHSSFDFSATFKEAAIKHLQIDHAAITIFEKAKDSIKGALQDFNLKLKDLSASVQNDNMQLSYDSYTIGSDSAVLALDPLNTLKIARITGDQDLTWIEGTELKTKYSPEQLQHYISHEKDYYHLSIDSIKVYHIPKVITLEDPPLKIRKLMLQNPSLFVYRDKLLADDLSVKPMMSELFRKVPYTFQIDSFEIQNASIRYKERVQPYNDGGELFFDDSQIKITNLSNSADKQPINIAINSRFCGKSEVKANWVMDVLNKDDEFSFSADIANVDLADINTFSQPNLNTKMQGKMRHLYYTISGNKYKSTIDVKSEYSDIKITVLDKTHRSKNKFYSSVANLIVSHKSKNKSSNFKTSKVLVDRDMTKSHINFLFKNVKEGLTKVFL